MRKSGETKAKKKNGRPKIEIDFTMVKNLCSIQCTGEEIASVLNINYDTLTARIKENFNESFSDYYKKASGSGKASLRRVQFELAKKSPAMCIWLGKQYLQQREPDNFVLTERETIPEFEKMTDEQLNKFIEDGSK